MNFDNYKNFFPKRVYHCSCLHSIIVSCLQDGIYSLGDICHRIRYGNTAIKKIYCAKCSDDKQDVVFSCCDHMAMIIFSVKTKSSSDKTTASIYCNDETKNYCIKCVKKYLQAMYYRYQHTIFDLPLAAPSRKRKLK